MLSGVLFLQGQEQYISVKEAYGSQNNFKLVKTLAQHLWIKHVERWLTFIVEPYLLWRS